MSIQRKWWKEAVIYQIYPRSFYDSNGDGIGDIKGIISKLDYLKELGINVIWLCPVYKSPNDDNGYDISDYYDIMDEFGTMADWEELLAGMHSRGLKLVMDLVVNHSSDEHPWFIEAKTDPESDKRNYYIWRKGKDGREPNNWMSFFTPSAWKYDGSSGEYFLHLFSEKQPDLNWENPALRNEIYEMMKFWLDKGIDGFRMDVINCISKVEGLPSVEPANEVYKWAGECFMNGPRVHEYLQEMNKRVLSKYDIMTVGETPGVTPEDSLLYVEEDRKELNMLFQFELMDIDSGADGKWDVKPWKLVDFKRIITKWQLGLHGKGWNSIYLNNHDQPRMVSRFGNDSVYRVESAKMLATMNFTLQGTTYVYQGEEIGMTNVQFASIDDYRDIEILNLYTEKVIKGKEDTSVVMRSIYIKGRDNARTPMQWSGEANSGFTSGKPWINVNPNYTEINVENALEDKDSILNYYKRLIQLRKEKLVFVYGEYIPLLEENEEIFSYMRQLGNERLLVILNFFEGTPEYKLPDNIGFRNKKLLLSNYEVDEKQNIGQFKLRPYEARVYALE